MAFIPEMSHKRSSFYLPFFLFIVATGIVNYIFSLDAEYAVDMYQVSSSTITRTKQYKFLFFSLVVISLFSFFMDYHMVYLRISGVIVPTEK